MVKKRTRRLSFMVAALMLLSLFAALPGIALAATVTPAPVTGVTSPVGGAAPSTAISDGDGFTAALAWNGSPAAFAYETAYTATVTLTAAETYDFDGLDNTESIAEFTVNSKAPVWVSNENGVLTFTVTFDATGSAPAPNITGVTAGTDTFAAAGGNSVITVAGTNLPADITVKAFLDDSATADESVTAGAVGGSATSRTVTLTFPENESAADEVYTVKVSLDGGTNWDAAADTVTVSAVSPTPVITSVSCSTATIEAAGGNADFWFLGTNLPNGMTVTAFLDGTATDITGTTTGTVTNQTVTLTFPANVGAANQTYTVKSSLDGGVNWGELPALVTVRSVTPAPPVITYASAVVGSDEISAAGGDARIAFHGTDLVNGMTVTAFDGTTATGITGITDGDGDTLQQRLTLTFPANTASTPKVYTVKISPDGGATYNETVTVEITVRGAPGTVLVTPAPLTGVTSPVAGALPSRTVNNGTGFTASIQWFATTNMTTHLISSILDETKPFEYGKLYSIDVRLTAKPGYAFWEASKGSASNMGGNATPELRAEAKALVESFTVNGITPSPMDIGTWFSVNPDAIYFTVVFPAAPSAPPATIPGNGGNTQIDYTLGANNSVSLEITADKTAELVADAVNGVVTINLAAVDNVQAADIPADALAAISDGLSLSLGFPMGTAAISGTALASFVDAAYASGTEKLRVTLRGMPSYELNAAQTAAVAGGESVYQIAVRDNTGEIHEFEGSFTITVPYGERTPNAAWYLKDDGTKEAVSFSLNNIAKTVTVTLPHLSLYGLSYEAVSATPAPTANQNGVPVTGDGNSAALWMLLTLVSLGSFAGLFVWQKKKSTDR